MKTTVATEIINLFTVLDGSRVVDKLLNRGDSRGVKIALLRSKAKEAYQIRDYDTCNKILEQIIDLL